MDITKLAEYVGCNKPASEVQVRICNVKLKQNKLPELPENYGKLLKLYNGFSNDDSQIFGAEIKNNNWYKDIVNFNISYFKNNPAKWLILGESSFFYFVYDAQQKKYYVVDRDSLEEELATENFLFAIEYMLQIAD